MESLEEGFTALELTLSEQVRTCVLLVAVTSVDIQMSAGLDMKTGTGYSTPREKLLFEGCLEFSKSKE